MIERFNWSGIHTPDDNEIEMERCCKILERILSREITGYVVKNESSINAL